MRGAVITLYVLSMFMFPLIAGAAEQDLGLKGISLGAKVKALYVHREKDDSAQFESYFGNNWGLTGDGVQRVAVTSAELDIRADAGEAGYLVIQLQASSHGWEGDNDLFGGEGGLSAGSSGPGELEGSMVGVRQAYVVFTDVYDWVDVRAGIFNPPLSVYQQRETNDWDLISLPVLNTRRFGQPQADLYYQPVGLGWQVAGAEIIISPVPFFEASLIWHNGHAGGETNNEIDLAKSFAGTVIIEPFDGIKLGGSYMSETWEEPDFNRQEATGWSAWLDVSVGPVELTADWMEMTAEDYGLDENFEREDLTWTGWQVTAGWWVYDELEVLARYEWVDPNTLDDEDADKAIKTGPLATYYYVPSDNNELTVITAGVNYRLGRGAELSVNYMFIQETGSDVDGNSPDDSLNGIPDEMEHEHQKIDNDTLLVQLQMWR